MLKTGNLEKESRILISYIKEKRIDQFALSNKEWERLFKLALNSENIRRNIGNFKIRKVKITSLIRFPYIFSVKLAISECLVKD